MVGSIRTLFLGFKITKHEVERPIFTTGELHDIMAKHFAVDRLKLVIDIFIFSCNTGLAYADV